MISLPFHSPCVLPNNNRLELLHRQFILSFFYCIHRNTMRMCVLREERNEMEMKNEIAKHSHAFRVLGGVLCGKYEAIQ